MPEMGMVRILFITEEYLAPIKRSNSVRELAAETHKGNLDWHSQTKSLQ